MAARFLYPLELVDPEGDLILEVGTLAVSSTANETSEKQEPKQDEEHEEDDEGNDSDRSVKSEAGDEDTQALQLEKADSTSPKRKYARILVCSKVLIWTSAVFRQMLNGSFKEAQQTPDAQGRRTLHLPEDDSSSMLALCKILHHRAASRRSEFPYELLDGLAILCDKYDFKEALYDFFDTEFGHWLDTGMQATLTSFSLNSPTRSLEVMRLAYLVDHSRTFRNATLIWAYVKHPETPEAALRDFFAGIPVPDTFFPRMMHLERYLRNKFEKMPLEAFKGINNYLLEQSGGSGGTVVINGIQNPSGGSLCSGVLKQMALATIFLAEKELLPSGNQASVQKYVLRMKNAFHYRPGIGCYCESRTCKVCHSSSRPELVASLQREWKTAMVYFWHHGLCLECVKEDRPLEKYDGLCKIHICTSAEVRMEDFGRFGSQSAVQI